VLWCFVWLRQLPAGESRGELACLAQKCTPQEDWFEARGDDCINHAIHFAARDDGDSERSALRVQREFGEPDALLAEMLALGEEMHAALCRGELTAEIL